jgi:hypothetical protein
MIPPTKQQKLNAYADEISTQLDNLTTELEIKVNKLKILTKQLIKTL